MVHYLTKLKRTQKKKIQDQEVEIQNLQMQTSGLTDIQNKLNMEIFKSEERQEQKIAQLKDQVAVLESDCKRLVEEKANIQ